MNSKLRKIQQENAKFQKEAPYNFCDRWCERCPQTTRDTCSLYQEDFEAKLQALAEGKDPDDWQTTFEMVKKNLEKTNMLLETIAKKEGIDLSTPANNPDFEDKKNEEKKMYQHPLFKQAIGYSRRVNKFIEQVFSRDEESLPELSEDFETLIWYHTLLPPKAHRVLCDLYVPDKVLEDISDGKDVKLCDAVAQAEICLKAIGESKKALKNIFALQLQDRYIISDLLETLEAMDQLIRKVLSEIDQGAV